MSETYITHISKLTPDTHNGNKGTERGNEMLRESMTKLKAGRSILLDKHGRIIGGNKSHAAATDLGYEDVIVVPTDGTKLVAVQRLDLDLDEDPLARELAWADNRVQQENFTLDLDKFKTDIEAGTLPTYLYNQDEIDAILKEANATSSSEEEGEADGSEEEESEGEGEGIEPRCKFGEVWELGEHRLMCGDSTNPDHIDELLDGDVPSMVFADPPYGIKAASQYADGSKRGNVRRGKFDDIANDDSTEVAIASSGLLLSMFPNSVHIWWGANYYANALPPSSCWIIWDKEQTSQFADGELAWTNQKTAVRIFKHQWNGMIRASERGEKRIHPTQKCKALVTWCGELYGKPNDIILDPFAGSGTVLMAAVDMGDRLVRCMEYSDIYCEKIMRRFEEKTGIQPKLA